jgi:hypothetical protein
MEHHLPAILAGVTLACIATPNANAALVIGSNVTPTFISGGWSLALTRSPSSPLVVGSGAEATFTGTHNYFLGSGTATYTLDFSTDIDDRSYLLLTAAFSNSPSSSPTIGSNFRIDDLDFGPSFKLNSVVILQGTAFISSLTNTGFNFSTGGVVISTTPQTIRMEMIPAPVPETTTTALIGLSGLVLAGRRRRSSLS